MSNEKYAIKGRYIDVLKNEAIDDGLVLVEGRKITYAGRADQAPAYDGSYKVIKVPEAGAAMPGFIDCHAHLVGSGDSETWVIEPREALLLRAVSDVRELLQSGFTGVRDMSVFGHFLRDAIEAGYIEGPHIVPGGQVLSITGGHADENTAFPYEIMKDNPCSYLCDGVDECIKAVRKQFREGAEFIKICATGGVSSSTDGVDDIQFSDEEVRAIVEEAKRHGAYVAAHCMGTAGTLQALMAGVGTVEHGTKLDEECVRLMKENGVSLVTTLSVSLGVAQAEGLPEWMSRKAKGMADSNKKSIALAHEAGINIALGTDYTNSSNSGFDHIGHEFRAIVSCGFTNMEALKIGTINAAKVMRMEDSIGSLDEGKFADIVISDKNPLDDIEAITESSGICFVMKEGKIVKDMNGLD